MKLRAKFPVLLPLITGLLLAALPEHHPTLARYARKKQVGKAIQTLGEICRLRVGKIKQRRKV